MQRDSFGTSIDAATSEQPLRAWVPPMLPPDPPLELSEDSRRKLDRALLALGRVDGVTTTLREAALVLPMVIRKEAALSAQLDGLECTFEDVLTFEAGATPLAQIDTVREVLRTVEALQHGLDAVSGGSPPSSRLLREMYGILKEGRGTSNPPDDSLRSAGVSNLDGYVRRSENSIVRSALAHLQFHLLQPFTDANGRMSRLLVMLMLCDDDLLQKPMFCPSLYFRLHQQRYQQELEAVRQSGDYERWIDFFAEAVQYSARAATRTARRVMQTFQEDRTLLRGVPRVAISLLLIQEALQVKPVATESAIRDSTGLTASTVHSMMGELVSRGIVNETSGRPKDKVYAYRRYLRALTAEDKAD